MKYYIWSIEHNAWWGPAEWGYKQHVRDAGLYSKEEAYRIVKRANFAEVMEAMIPESAIALDLTPPPEAA